MKVLYQVFASNNIVKRVRCATSGQFTNCRLWSIYTGLTCLRCHPPEPPSAEEGREPSTPVAAAIAVVVVAAAAAPVGRRLPPSSSSLLLLLPREGGGGGEDDEGREVQGQRCRRGHAGRVGPHPERVKKALLKNRSRNLDSVLVTVIVRKSLKVPSKRDYLHILLLPSLSCCGTMGSRGSFPISSIRCLTLSWWSLEGTSSDRARAEIGPQPFSSVRSRGPMGSGRENPRDGS